jgi:hypothetical protein
MKTTVVVLAILFLAISGWASTNQIATSAVQREEVLRVPELDQLISTIHSDLLKLKGDHAWLSAYATNCLWESRWIHYCPPRKHEGGPQPQQSDQLMISYLPIDQEKGAKYENDLEDIPACRFPTLKAKVHAYILVGSRDDAETAETIRKCIIRRCEALHKELKH